MRRLLFMALAFTTLVNVLGAGATDDLKKMAGAWDVTIIERDGKAASADEKRLKIRLVVEGERYKTYLEDKYLSGGTIKLDAAKKPRAIDATYTDGPLKDTVQRGVYEITAEGLHVNFAKPGKDRPAEIKTKEGSEEVLMYYTRAQK
jgi:uncharacterized protein (TIGR03067 family)